MVDNFLFEVEETVIRMQTSMVKGRRQCFLLTDYTSWRQTTLLKSTIDPFGSQNHSVDYRLLAMLNCNSRCDRKKRTKMILCIIPTWRFRDHLEPFWYFLHISRVALVYFVVLRPV